MCCIRQSLAGVPKVDDPAHSTPSDRVDPGGRQVAEAVCSEPCLARGSSAAGFGQAADVSCVEATVPIQGRAQTTATMPGTRAIRLIDSRAAWLIVVIGSPP